MAEFAQLAIHLIYDERQQESEQRREHITQLEANQQVWKDKKRQLDQIEQEIMRSKQKQSKFNAKNRANNNLKR